MKNLLLAISVLLVAVVIVNAGKKKIGGCKYIRQKSPCENGTRTITLTLKKKLQPDAVCNDTMVTTKPCRIRKKCKYDFSQEVSCDPHHNTMVKVNLLKGTEGCSLTKEISCRSLKKKQTKKADKKNKKQNRKESKIRKKENRKKYRKENKMKRKLEKKERKRNKLNKRNKAKCKYVPGQWQDCDQSTDTMSRTYTLSSGDPQVCPAAKVLTQKCRKLCKYKAGKWSKCNPQTLMMERMDTLKPKSASFCSKNRTITRACKKNKQKCKYDKGVWGDCDPATKKRTKTMQLKSKGKNSKCPETRTVQRTCSRPDGTERCFFGQWQDWEDCQNGVQKKHRAVIGGGDECQRRSVKTRMCSNVDVKQP